jgi:hypothetical protein
VRGFDIVSDMENTNALPHATYAQAVESQDFSGYTRRPSAASIRARKAAETADPINRAKLLEIADKIDIVRGVFAAHYPHFVKNRDTGAQA